MRLKWQYIKHCNSKLFKGFTLAEVLITIGIIGVVAAVTIPTLITNHQKKVTVTRLKQTYSQLSQAIKLSEAENGDVATWNILFAEWNSDEQYNVGKQFADQYLFPYLQTSISDCGSKTNNQCFGNQSVNWYGFMLRNGVIIRLQIENEHSVLMMVHLNGAEKKVSGKDVFYMYLTTRAGKSATSWYGTVDKPGLYMAGQGYSRDQLMNTVSYKCSKTAERYVCGRLIQLDGWEIKNDYPW